jgi:hypothetical protein
MFVCFRHPGPKFYLNSMLMSPDSKRFKKNESLVCFHQFFNVSLVFAVIKFLVRIVKLKNMGVIYRIIKFNQNFYHAYPSQLQLQKPL